MATEDPTEEVRGKTANLTGRCPEAECGPAPEQVQMETGLPILRASEQVIPTLLQLLFSI
jgi:hypothetical protein